LVQDNPNTDELRSGASLALITVLQRIQAHQQIPTALLLVAPAQLDNTLTLESFTGWRRMKHAPWTGVDTAMSFRELYLPHGAHPWNWLQNPLNFPEELMDGVRFPPTFNLLMGVDLFLEEGKMLTNRLRQYASVVDEKIFHGLPHMALGMGRMFPEVLEHISNVLRTIFSVDDYMYTGLYTDLPLPQDRSDRHWFIGNDPIGWPDSLLTNVRQAYQLRREEPAVRCTRH
jgi:acetyl esterase/lipase